MEQHSAAIQPVRCDPGAPAGESGAGLSLFGPTLTAASRGLLLTLGVAATTGLSVLTAAAWGLDVRSSVIWALPWGSLIGGLLAMVLILLPEARAASDRRRMIRRIELWADAERSVKAEELGAVDPRHELAELASAVGRALSSAHAERMETARRGREINAVIERETRRRCAHLTALSVTDELTGLANRRGFKAGLEAMVERAVAREDEVALLAIDLDHFKALNDTCGHDKGDEALSIAGDLLQAHVREGDLAGRMGGDEMFIAMYGVGASEAERVAERIMHLFGRHPAGRGLPCPWPSMSVGIATLRGGGVRSASELRRLADEALYASKRGGRSRCTTYGAVA